MKSRLELVPVEEARRLGAEMGINEAQASRSAFRMLANHPDLVLPRVRIADDALVSQQAPDAAA